MMVTKVDHLLLLTYDGARSISRLNEHGNTMAFWSVQSSDAC